MKPAVSIILPTYNRADLILRSINSVLAQTAKDFELIIIDDGSTDNSENIIRNIMDPRLRYIKLGKNLGGSAARNTGIRTAKADFIAFQDSDDEWLPEKLEKQIKILRDTSSNLGVVYSGFWRLENGKKTYLPSPDTSYKHGHILNQLLYGNFITTQAALVRKCCFEKVGLFDESLPRLQDWELFLRIAKYYEFKYINEPLVLAYFSRISITSDPHAYFKALEIILQKHHDIYSHNIEPLSMHQLSLGDYYCKLGNMARGRKYLFKALILNPLNFINLSAAFFSIFGSTAYIKASEIRQMISR